MGDEKMTEDSKEIKGVCLLFIDSNGIVIAHAVDFDPSAYGGYNVIHSQRMRARKALNSEVMRACCSEDVCRATTEHQRAAIVNSMVNNGGHIHVVTVGWPDSNNNG